jgi:hypothetical protein
MSIKDVLAKVAAGEALTDEDKAIVKGFDPDKVANDSAAAARRKAEAAAAEARAEAEALKAEKAEQEAARAAAQEGKQTEAQKQAKALEAMQKEVAAIKKERDEAKQVSARMARQQTLAEIRQAHGLVFTDKVRPAIANTAWASTFDDISDLSDAEAVKERVAQFRAENPGLIVDNSGHGTGEGGKGAAGSVNNKPVNMAERKKQMQEAGLIS